MTVSLRARLFFAALALFAPWQAIAASPSISISDARVQEGNSPGQNQLEFKVTLSAPSEFEVKFKAVTEYATTGLDDFEPTIYTVTMPAGTTSWTLVLPITGDTYAEDNEYLRVNIVNATNAVFERTVGFGQILNDDGIVLASVQADPTQVATNGDSYSPSISADGRYVAFVSNASMIVPGSGNFYSVYVRDTVLGTTTLASVGVNASAPNGASLNPRLSADGRYVTFQSSAFNLVANDTNGATPDIFLRDLQTGVTTLVSVGVGGISANAESYDASVSNDGKKIVFTSEANNLVAGDANGSADVFLRDLNTGTTTLLSVASGGSASGGSSPAISGNGRYVAFESTQALIAGDAGLSDIYLRDLVGGTLSRVSLAPGGAAPNGDSYRPAISTDGSKIVFTSKATNLVTGLTDSNNAYDVFVRDVPAGTTAIASLASNGALLTDGVACSGCPVTQASISGDGGRVGFVPRFAATSDDQNTVNDVYVRNMAVQTTTRISKALHGGTGTGGGYAPSLSADGQFVAFASGAPDIVAGGYLHMSVFVAGRTGSLSPVVALTNLNDTLGSLTPQFSPEVRSYTQSTASNYVIFGATARDSNATVKINGLSEFTGHEFPLQTGQNVFTVLVTAHDGVTTQSTTVTVTRTSQDLPKLSVASVSVTEGNSGTKPMTFVASLTSPSPTPVSFRFETLNNGATAGSDFVAANETVTIPAGQTSQAFSVTIIGDTLLETDEQLRLYITDLVGAELTGDAAFGTILNDEPGGTPAISIADVSITEGNSGTKAMEFSVSLSFATTFPVTYDIVTDRGTASYPTDFEYASLTGQVIPAGSTSKKFSVNIVGDTEIETNETLLVNLFNISGASWGDTQAFGTIVNDDVPAMPSVSIGDVSIAEGDAGTKLATFTVSLSAPASTAVTYNIATSNGSAAAGSDYVASSLAGQSIPAGQTSKTFSVTINGDTAVEPTEIFLVTVSSISGATAGDVEALGTITNDDLGGGIPSLSIGDLQISEGNSGTQQLTFIVSLSGPASGAVTYDIATSDGSATAPSDYEAKALTGQSIPAGSLSKSFTVVIKGDSELEATELFNVIVTNVVGATVADYDASGLIVNDDGLHGKPSLSIADATVTEGNSGTKLATFSISLSGPASTPVNYTVSTANVTATAGSDYTGTDFIWQSIPVGSTSSTFSVEIAGDTSVESDETFLVSIGTVDGATLADGQALGTITNDDFGGALTLGISDVSIVEGNSGSKLATFTLSLSAPASTAVTYDIATAAGTATAPADFVNKSLTGQSIPAGETSKTFTVSIKGDTVGEPDETFFVNVTNVVGATLSDGQAVGTITNDDAVVTPTLSIDDISITEGNAGTKLATFTISLSAAPTNTVTYDIEAAAFSASPGSDYVATGLVHQSISPGQTSKTFDVQIVGDVTSEPDEVFNVLTSNVVGATVLDGQAKGTILNDDGAAVPSISIGGWSDNEGNSGTKSFVFSVNLTNASSSPVTFDIATANGTATAGVDYVAMALTGQTIAPGEITKDFMVTINGDTTVETDETFTVNLSNISGANIIWTQATGEISNDDVPGMPTLSIADVSIAEGDSGTKTATFTVSLSEAAAGTVTYDIGTSNGTATAGSDYVSAGFSGQSIAAGQTSKTFSVTINGDTAVESDETFTVNVSNVVGATLPDSQAVGTITNDDGGGSAPTLSIGDVSITEGNSNSKLATFTLTLSAPAATAVTYNIATAAGTATAPSDFVNKSQTNQSIAAGQTSKTFTVSIKGDTVTEPDENFFVNVTNVAGATLADGQAMGTITNDDGVTTPTLNIADVSISEGNSGTKTATFTVSLSAAAAGAVTYDIATSNGTATAGSDYVASSLGGQSITAGQTSKTFSVTINGDTTVESDETFTVTVSNVAGATISDGSAIGTITNDDSSGSPTLTIGDLSISEGNSGVKEAVFTVMLSAPASGAVTYDIATSNGTATAGSDYVAKSLVGQPIPAGFTSKTFAVELNGDTMEEGDETFFVTVSNVSGATLGDGQALGTITNDDNAPTPGLSISDLTITEGNSGTKQATFTLSLSSPAPTVVSYNIATSNGTATAGSDYVSGNWSGETILAGETSKTFNVAINGDTTVESDETFTVNISNLTGATLADGQAVGTITNDDGAVAPTLSIGDVSIVEGNSGSKLATFTLTLSAPAATAVTYNIATAAGTATAPADFVNKSQTGQSIAAGQTSKTFTVSIKGDTVIEPDETFFVNVTNVAGATLADGQAIGTITNDDGALVEFEFSDVFANEGSSGSNPIAFTVTLSAPASTAVTFDIATEDMTAVAGSDYTALNLTNQSIPAGQTSKTFNIVLNGDTTIEPAEQLRVRISNVSGADTDGVSEAFIYIANDDGVSSPSISIQDVAGSEGDSSGAVMMFNVLLDQPADHPVTFDIATSNGTATAGSDYQANSQTITIPALTRVGIFSVIIDGDTTNEPDETLFVNLSNVIGATVTDGQAVGTIQNDDGPPPPTLSIGNVTIAEGNSGTKTATFTVSLSAAAAGAVTYDIATSNGTATAGSDYVASSLSGQSIAAGQTSQTFSVTINGDTTVESDETFTVTVSNVAGATISDGSAIGTISNDDTGGGGPTLSIGDVTLAEGNALNTQFTFTVSLSAAASSAVTFNIATADGTALAGSDYTAKSLNAQSIAAGQTSKTFIVAVKGDRAVEPNETFLVNVTNVAGATLADGQAVGTITNDDAGLVSIARVATGGLVDDIDDDNGQPVLGKDDYALLLLDTAQAVCERVQAPTIVGIDGVENKAVLEELALTANVLCARKPKYAAVFNEGQGSDGLGFLVDIADDTHLEGVRVIDARDLGQEAKVSTLTMMANGHDQAMTVLLVREAASSKPRQANELDRYLVARRKLDPEARLVVLGASGLSGLVDVSARAALAQKPTELSMVLPAERIFVSQPLLDAFGASSVVLPAKTVDPQVLNLRP